MSSKDQKYVIAFISTGDADGVPCPIGPFDSEQEAQEYLESDPDFTSETAEVTQLDAPADKREFTVTLQRPDHLCQGHGPSDFPVFFTRGHSVQSAVDQARKIAAITDEEEDPDDYRLVTVFEGRLSSLENAR